MTILFWVALIFLVLSSLYMYFISLSPQAGPVYKPTKNEDVEKMLVIAASSRGAQAIGYEIDPFLVHQSRKRIKKLGLQDKAEIKLKSFWQADFNQATVVATYLFPKYMLKLKKKLQKSLNHPVKLVSNDYQIPDLDYLQKEGSIYLYKIIPLLS